MTLFELFLDRLNDTVLFEMARSRNSAKERITNLSPQIFEHLIKLFVFNSPENKDHWIKEVNIWFSKIDEIYLKPKHNKPGWQTIYNWMIFDSSPNYDSNYVNGRVNIWKNTEYENVPVYDYDAAVVLNQILKIIENVCKDIAVPNTFKNIRDYL